MEPYQPFYGASYLMITGNMSKDTLYAAALSMEEAFFTRGQHIIIQDQVGDTFYLIEEGQVVVTVRTCLYNL